MAMSRALVECLRSRAISKRHRYPDPRMSVASGISAASPGIAGEMLYVGSTSGKLIAIDLEKQKTAWTFETDGSKQNGRALTKPDQ